MLFWLCSVEFAAAETAYYFIFEKHINLSKNEPIYLAGLGFL